MAYLPDVNLVSGYANQTGASYIQPNIGYLGLTANYTFWEWGKKRDLSSQREIDLRMAHQSLHLARDKVQLEARQAYGSFAQALTTYQLRAKWPRLAATPSRPRKIGPRLWPPRPPPPGPNWSR